ncbi:MAG: hypothetical protein PVF66_09720, partial [Candidatus Aminicenantes bacterium]
GLKLDTGKLPAFETEFQPLLFDALKCLTGLAQMSTSILSPASLAGNFFWIFLDFCCKCLFEFLRDVAFINLAVETIQATGGGQTPF